MDSKSQSDNAKQFLQSAIAFADRPVKELVAKRDGKDVDEMWGSDVMVSTGHILVECKDDKKYKLELGLVEKEYKLDLGELDGDEKALSAASYLIHCAQTIGKMTPTITRTLKVDTQNTTLYFHSLDDHRLGLVITPAHVESGQGSQSTHQNTASPET